MAINTDAEQPKARKARGSAHRVEATNALALANQELAGGLQTTLKTAIEAQVQIGQQAAQIAHALETGEIGWAAFHAELAALRQDPAPLTPNWGALDMDAVISPGLAELCGVASAEDDE